MPRRFRNACGPLISRIRKEKGLTQDQFAARLALNGLVNMDAMVIAKIEGQHRSVFDFELMMIATVLDVPLSDLRPDSKTLHNDLPNLIAGEQTDDAD